MEKRGRVELGKTPSVKSGKPSTKFSNGEPAARGEIVKKSVDQIARKLSKRKD
jgi:hypothetical protein